MKARYQLKKKDIINDYIDLRNEAHKEVSIDITRQTIAILLASMRINGRYDDDTLRSIFEDFVKLINTGEIMGTPLRSDEVTDTITRILGIDLERINPKVMEE
jgi:hypothetical protein